MILLADIGNHYFKWKFGGQSGQFNSTSKDLNAEMDVAFGKLKRPTACFLSSVVSDSAEAVIAEWFYRIWDREPVFVQAAQFQCGVTSSGYDLNQLGVDRWLALVGARALTKKSAIVVDCGTAITVDALTATGEFVGGSVLVGFQTASRAISDSAFGLPQLDHFQAVVPAQSTMEALSSGTALGLAGGIDRLVEEYLNLVEAPAALLMTGGDAGVANAHTKFDFEIVPDLVLQGLARAVDGNS